jgi:hypothetical protein
MIGPISGNSEDATAVICKFIIFLEKLDFKVLP